MPQTAVEAEQLVTSHWRYAHSIARRWSSRYPHLRAEFESQAAFTLWRAASDYDTGRGTFEGWLAYRLRLALYDVWRKELATAPTSFAPQFTPRSENDAHPLDAARSREADPADAAELLDLPDLLTTLPQDRRRDLERHFAGTTAEEIASEQDTPAPTLRARFAADLQRLRRLANVADE